MRITDYFMDRAYSMFLPTRVISWQDAIDMINAGITLFYNDQYRSAEIVEKSWRFQVQYICNWMDQGYVAII